MARKIIIVGAGIGGLSAAVKLAHAGHHVHVIDAGAQAGGKIRTHLGSSGPIDIGPTVLTLLPVFQRLFASIEEDIHEHITLTREPILARHWWPDGTMLDLHDNFEQSATEITAVFGKKSGKEFSKFYNDSRLLFDCFDKPVMQNARPNLLQMMRATLKRPSVIGKMKPLSSLGSSLSSYFSDPRLAQLFGRYATYVGGTPQTAPALMSLIWQAEARGVWTIKGGMNRLARVLEQLCIERGVTFTFNTSVTRIRRSADRVVGVDVTDGTQHTADAVIFNGDPRSLSQGDLGPDVETIARSTKTAKRSLSAYVWGFDAPVEAANLAHHNVFFADRPNSEFDDISRGLMPVDPTIYVCAQDRGANAPTPHVDRFEIILNAPPLSQRAPEPEDFDRCKAITFNRLERFGLTFHRQIGREHLTMPQDFAERFPASDGSLYGQSPEGMLSTLRRPTCVTPISNLFLVGGGVHPGAGVPMAALCGQLAVDEMTRRQILT